MSLFGSPSHVYCDRGSQFTSGTLKELISFLGAKLQHATSYHPQAQVIVERVNRTLKTALEASESPSEWHDNLPWTLLALHNLPKKDMSRISSNGVVFGEPLRLPGAFFDSDREGNVLETATTDYVLSIAKRVSSFQYHPPRKSKPNFYVDSMLRNPQTTHVFVRQDTRVPLLHPAYKDPYKILLRSEKFFLLDYIIQTDRVSIDRLKPAFLSWQTF